MTISRPAAPRRLIEAITVSGSEHIFRARYLTKVKQQRSGKTTGDHAGSRLKEFVLKTPSA